ncbi:MAG: FAD-dependent oxidoreductase [Pseudomonadota bacterium]
MDSSSTTAPIVIVGSGLAAWTLARELRKLDAHAPLCMVCQDSGDFYSKPALSNAFSQGRRAAALVTTPAAAMAHALALTLLPFTRVEAIDASAKTVRLSGPGQVSTLAYAELVLATGARPIAPPIGGGAPAKVMTVNSLDDFARFDHCLRGAADTPATAPARTIVLIGAGLIGCEFANDLAAAGHVVHVVDPAPRALAALLPEAASLALQQALAPLGVHWHLGSTVHAVDDDPAGGAGLLVTLSCAVQIRADLVLSAVGLRADTTLAQAAGIVCERAIGVDRQLKTSLAHIHALGDCAQYASAGGRTLPFVMPIMHAAKTLASNLCGASSALAFPQMPIVVKTPALPLTLLPPDPAALGQWQAGQHGDAGIWRFVDAEGRLRGFVLSGPQTARRAELLKSTVPFQPA